MRGRGHSPQRIVVVAYKATADVVSKAVTLVVTMAAARVLAPEEFGTLALAMTTGWLLSVASDAGLPLDLARQMAQAAADGRSMPRFGVVRDALAARLGFAGVAVVIAVIVAIALVPMPLVAAFVVIALALLLNASLETVSHAFRGLGRSDLEASISLAQRLTAGTAACLVLFKAPSLLGVALALAIPPAVAIVAAVALVRRMTAADHDQRHGPTDRPLSARFLREVAPVGAAILLSAIYFRCDVYFVERWHGLDTVGLYNAAFRIVEALRLLPAAVMAVMFPVFCTTRTWQPAKPVLTMLGAISLLLAGVLSVTAPVILDVAYGARFVAAAPALTVLAAAVPFFFVNYVLTHLVIAWDRQRAYLAVTAAALTTNLAANTLLIPTGGMRGAALATLVTEIVVFAGCAWALAGRSATTASAVVPAVSMGDGRALSGDSL